MDERYEMLQQQNEARRIDYTVIPLWFVGHEILLLISQKNILEKDQPTK